MATLFERTLAEARDWYHTEARKHYVVCPCCDRKGRYLSRPLNAGAARAAAWMHLCAIGAPGTDPIIGDGFVRMRKSSYKQILEDAEYAHLKYWGLAVAMVVDPIKNTNKSGVWKLTAKGTAFVTQGLRVYSHAVIYNDKLIEYEGRLVSIKECFKAPFDFDELMGGGYLDEV